MSESDLENLVDSIDFEKPIKGKISCSADEQEIEEVGQEKKAETPNTGKSEQVGGATQRAQ